MNKTTICINKVKQ